jgi:hypothetical protein
MPRPSGLAGTVAEEAGPAGSAMATWANQIRLVTSPSAKEILFASLTRGELCEEQHINSEFER